jgi:GNAT superfamily N-acetyltransferase
MQIRVAQPIDLEIVAAVLSAAAAKLVDKGQALWTNIEVSESTVAPHIQSGLYHLGIDRGEVVGVFRLQLEDLAFWPEIQYGTSAFLHKLAILPQMQGRGLAHELLSHAVRITREKGLKFLRLDCAGGRPRLRSVYESFGFRHHSDIRIDASTFHRFEYTVAPD